MCSCSKCAEVHTSCKVYHRGAGAGTEMQRVQSKEVQVLVQRRRDEEVQRFRNADADAQMLSVPYRCSEEVHRSIGAELHPVVP